MSDYLSYEFADTPGFVNAFDELPLWSAPFGMLLLKHLELRPDLTVVDIGSGTGFPLFEIASRLGGSAKCYGLDPWTNANDRARRKATQYGMKNVEIIDGSAEAMPFADKSTDLIVSNLGINNFPDPVSVLKECRRILKPGGRLAATTNTSGHWKEFYDIFESVLVQSGRTDIMTELLGHRQQRGTRESISAFFSGNGFEVTRLYEEEFQMRFLDGGAFLNHHFVKPGWLGSWKKLLPADEMAGILTALEDSLNTVAAGSDGLSLTVPVLFIEGEKSP